MTVPDTTLLALFLMGLLGGVHCAGMCGGIVGALGLLDARSPAGAAAVPARPMSSRSPPAVAPLRFMPSPVGRAGAVGLPVTAPVPPGTANAHARVAARSAIGGDGRSAMPPWSRRLVRTLAYNAGRLSTYTVLGSAAGAVGSFGWLLGEALPLQQFAYAASGVLLIATGLHVAGERRLVRALEGLGGGVWRHVRPAATAALARAGSPGGALAAGALWGLVPCGMVYAALASALLGASAARGAALMLAFGLGTLPNLLLLGAGAERLGRLVRHRPVRLVAGITIAAFGVLGLFRLDIATEVPLLRELCVRLPSGFGA